MGRLGDKIDLDPGLMLTPGERADVVFTPSGEIGHEFFMTWNDFPRGRHMAMRNDAGMIMLSHAHDDGHMHAHNDHQAFQTQFRGADQGPRTGGVDVRSQIRAGDSE